MELGPHVKEIRKELREGSKEFSLRKVAARVGITPGFLSQFESGKTPPPSEKVIISLAKDLREDPDVFLAMAGKLSPRFRKAVSERPKFFAELMSTVENLPADAVLRVVREVKDGKW